MKMTPTLALMGAAAALGGGPQMAPEPPEGPCRLHEARAAAFVGDGLEPYESIEEARAAIRVLDASPGTCGFGTTYNLSRRLVASVWRLPSVTLRQPVHDAVVRAMWRAYHRAPPDRVQMFGQIKLALELERAGLAALPAPWARTIVDWAEGWGPSPAERDLWRGFMRSWFDGA